MIRVSRQLLRLGTGSAPRALAGPSPTPAIPRTPAVWQQRFTYATKDSGSKTQKTTEKTPEKAAKKAAEKAAEKTVEKIAAADGPIFSAIDPKRDAEIAQQPIKSPPPSQVSSTSTTAAGFQQPTTKAGPRVVSSDLRKELNSVKDAFSLESVPKEATILGLAGTLPYLGTSLSTVFLSWSVNKPWPAGPGFINSMAMNHDSAAYYLALLEPIQLAWGAIIVSFLGAIHWGMEFNERSRPDYERTKARYAIGVAAPAVAWPTLLMPFEAALTGQFAAFAGLYFTDARMAERGWAPRWYAPYRFILTAVVGAAIGVTLIGRAKITNNHLKRAHHATLMDSDLAASARGHDWVREEEEERARRLQQAEKDKQQQPAEEEEDTQKQADGGPEKKQQQAAGDSDQKNNEESKKLAAGKEGQKGDQDVGGESGIEGQHPKANAIKAGEKTEGGTGGQTARKEDRKADKTKNERERKSEGKDKRETKNKSDTKEAPEGDRPPTKRTGKTVGED